MGRWWQHFQFNANYHRKVWHDWSTKLSRVNEWGQRYKYFLCLFIYLFIGIWLTNLGGMTLITNSRKWHTRDNTSSGADGSNRNLSWNMWEVWLIPFFSHRRVWMPCLTHKQRTSLTETRPFHLQNIGKRKVSSALLLLNQHVKQWK